MVDANLHAGILSSKADDHPSLFFSGIRDCSMNTGEQFVGQFARVLQDSLLDYFLANRTTSAGFRLYIPYVGEASRLKAQTPTYKADPIRNRLHLPDRSSLGKRRLGLNLSNS